VLLVHRRGCGAGVDSGSQIDLGTGAVRAGSMAARRHFLSSLDMRGNKNSSSAVLSTSWNESWDVPSARKKRGYGERVERTMHRLAQETRVEGKGHSENSSSSFRWNRCLC